jgi:hypothetical protein
MIYQFDAAEIGAHLTRGGADFLFVTEDCYARQSLTGGGAGRGHGARILALGQNDVLQVGGGALADLIENTQGVVRGQLVVVSCSLKSRANLS